MCIDLAEISRFDELHGLILEIILEEKRARENRSIGFFREVEEVREEARDVRDRSMAENEIWNGVSLKRRERRGGKVRYSRFVARTRTDGRPRT